MPKDHNVQHKLKKAVIAQFGYRSGPTIRVCKDFRGRRNSLLEILGNMEILSKNLTLRQGC